MDFFQHQDNARRKTKWLVFYFILSALAITLITSTVVYGFVSFLQSGRERSAYEQIHIQQSNAMVFFASAAATVLVIISGSVYKISELSSGGKAVAMSLGGKLLNLNVTNLDEKKLRNVVEEMAIASGIPVPQIFVLPKEGAINAFAAGFTSSDAVIGVTRGAMQTLTRDELQGVIGHEFSHILNGDMRLNIRLLGLLNGILCISIIGCETVRLAVSSEWDGNFKNALGEVFVRLFCLLFGGSLVVVGTIGVIFGHLIKSAVSRQREFLADASSAQFTRNPAGLSGALKKIGGLYEGSQLNASSAEEASHLFFSNGIGESWTSFTATHPPLEERIRVLEPGWDGKYPVVTVEKVEMFSRVGSVSSLPLTWADSKRLRGTLPDNMFVGNQEITANAGAPTPQQVSYAAELRNAIPDEVRNEARESMGACAIIYSLLLHRDEPRFRAQSTEFVGRNSAALYQETIRIHPMICGLDPRLKLPLVNLCLPALRQLSKSQYYQFANNVRLLIESDRQVYLFEYMLQKVVLRHLEPIFNEVRRTVLQYYVFKPLEQDAVVLLSALSRHGGEDQDQMLKTFRNAAAHLKFTLITPCLLADGDCGLAQLDQALKRFSQAAPIVKKMVLNACACAVAADGVVQMKEAEMLRAIADSLDCPIPPFVQNV